LKSIVQTLALLIAEIGEAFGDVPMLMGSST
jgi:hypothetical protein